MAGQVQTLERGMKLQVVNGTTFKVPIRRTRRRFKLPKKTRDRMRKSANKIKIPIVQGTLIGYGISDAVIRANLATTKTERFKAFADRIMLNYTGWNNSASVWTPSKAKGAMATGAWFIGSKLGLFKMANSMLGRYKVPFLRV